MRELSITLVLLSATASLACPTGGTDARPDQLSIAGSSFSTSSEVPPFVTTLGAIKNVGPGCLESIVVEVKYLNAQGQLIDSTTSFLRSVVALPNQEVAFRIRDVAAMPKEAYASQQVRIVTAEPYSGRGSRSDRTTDTLWGLLASWGPILLLIAVWVFFMQRMKRKDSPQGQIIKLIEEQNAAFETQNQLLARLATAAEARVPERDGI